MKTLSLILMLNVSFSCLAQDQMYENRPVNLRIDGSKEAEYRTGKRLLIAGLSAILIGSTVRWAVPQFAKKPQASSPTLTVDAAEFLHKTRHAVDVGSAVMVWGGVMAISGGVKMSLNRRPKIEASF